MAEDAENDERSAAEASTPASPPGLSDDARRRIGHHLQNLYAPALRAPLDERLVELLSQISGEAPKKRPADNDDSPLAGDWT
jgi:hypothetical protein